MVTEEESKQYNHSTSKITSLKQSHSSPVRRKSPRLLSSSSSSSPSHSSSQTKPIMTPLDTEKSMVLSMDVRNKEEEEAIPLQIYYPNLDQKYLRRSPGYTTNKYRSAFLALPSYDSRTPEIQLGRSPRFLSGGKNANLREMGDGILLGSKKRLFFEKNQCALHGSEYGEDLKKIKFSLDCLRKSPRLNRSIDEVNRGFLDLPRPGGSSEKSGEEKHLRKSPRLNPNCSRELLALPEHDSDALVKSNSGKCVSSGKQLRN